MLDEAKALEILKQHVKETDVIKHCITVNKVAMRVCNEIVSKNPELTPDVNLVYWGSILHDIGRSKTHGIKHGLEGCKILEELAQSELYKDERDTLLKIAKICKFHIGAGLDEKDAKELGLPEGSYMPMTLEEKIVAYADNLVEGADKVRDDKWAEEMYEKKFGPGGKPTKRLKELNAFIRKLM